MMGDVISMLVLVALTQIVVKPREAVNCRQVDASLASCIPYPTTGGTPAAACCDGMKNLKTLITTTTADRRAACDCVKAAAARYPSIEEDAASSLPQKCGAEMDIPISRTTNCAKRVNTNRCIYLKFSNLSFNIDSLP